MALLDTGATTSGIKPTVVEALGLLGLGKRPIGLAQGEGQAQRYLFRVGLLPTALSGNDTPALPFIFDAVMGFGLDVGFRFEMLLGMDILSQCDFQMTRWGRANLSFG